MSYVYMSELSRPPGVYPPVDLSELKQLVRRFRYALLDSQHAARDKRRLDLALKNLEARYRLLNDPDAQVAEHARVMALAFAHELQLVVNAWPHRREDEDVWSFSPQRSAKNLATFLGGRSEQEPGVSVT